MPTAECKHARKVDGFAEYPFLGTLNTQETECPRLNPKNTHNIDGFVEYPFLGTLKTQET